MIKPKMVTAALVAFGVLVSLEYTSVAQQTTPSSQPSQPATQQNQTKISTLDRQFITDAAQGGMAEVSLGQLATQRATSDEVKQYGQRMVQEHTRANKELMQLATKKGVTPPTTLGSKYEAVRARLLQVPGGSFDQAYMNEAGVNGHLESAAVYQRQIQLGQDQDLKAFAAKTLPTVQEHLQMAQGMARNTTGSNQNPSSPRPMK
jgi:putative membrane protein